MNSTDAFTKLRETGTGGEDAYVTMLSAAYFSPAVAVTENGSSVRFATDEGLGTFSIETIDEALANALLE